MSAQSFVCIPVPVSTVTEWMSRLDDKETFASHMASILDHWLETKADEPDLWGEAYAEKLADKEISALVDRAVGDWVAGYGAASKGYTWQNVTLPNGTKLRITYKAKAYFAEVKHQQIVFDNMQLSPSEFASKVANNTSRNAWKDIWVKRPTDKDWVFADDLRRRPAS